MAHITGELVLATFDDGANGQGSGDNLTDRSSNARLFRLGSATGADTADMGWGSSPARGTFGGDDYVYIPGGTGSLIAAWAPATANYTQIFLCRFNDLTGSTSVKRPLIAHNASGDRTGMVQAWGGGYLDAFVGSVRLQSAAGVLTSGQWHFVISRRNGANGVARVDNTVVAASAAVANASATGANYTLGANPGFSQFLIGDEGIWEIYGRALTDAEIDEELQHILATYAEPRGITVPGVPLASTAVDVASSAHTHTAERVSTLVTAADSLQPHTAERTGVSVAPADSTQAQAAQSAPIVALPEDVAHSHVSPVVAALAGVAASSSAHLSELARAEIAARDSPHAHISEAVAVSAAVLSSNHTHEAQTVGVGVSVAGGLHAHVAEPVGVNATVQDAVHPHLSATAALAGAAVGYITRPGIRDASAMRTLANTSPVRTIANASRARAVQDSSKTRTMRDA